MKTQQQIKMSIMGRVYMAYAMRRIFRSSTLRALLSVGSLLWVFSVVSVLNVIKNLIAGATTPSSFYNFLVTALSKTDVTVQLSIMVFTVALFWYAFDLVKKSQGEV